MKRKHMLTILSVPVLTLILSLSLVGTGCKKPQQQPGEAPDVYKKRLVAIYFAQSGTGIDGFSDVIDAMVNNEVLTKATGAKALELDTKAAKSWQEAVKRAKTGDFGATTVDKLNEAIKFAEDLEAVGVIDLKDPKQKADFILVTKGLRLALTSAKNLILALNGPNFNTQIKQAEAEAQSFSKIGAALDITNIVMVTLGRAAQQSWLPTEGAAYEDGEKIIAALLLKNDERIKSYRQ
jgi:hypothetical protein